MGMSASQARLLSLTARLSDLEYSNQQISNDRQRLSVRSQQVSEEYTKALNKETLKFKQTDSLGSTSSVKLTAKVLLNCGLAGSGDVQRMLLNSSGAVMVSNALSDKFSQSTNLSTFLELNGCTSNTYSSSYNQQDTQYYTNLYNQMSSSAGYNTISDDDLTDESWLSEQLISGNFILSKYNANKTNSNGTIGGFDLEDWASEDNDISASTDSAEMAKAEAKYDAEMSSIQSKDKYLEMSQKNLDTEHSAVQTEYDSVKKVIDKNIERSFKV